MPDVNATGPLSKPFALMAELLAGSATFRTLVGAGSDETAALEFIDYPYRDVEADGYLIPGAYLFDDDAFEQFKIRKDGSQAGRLGLVISADVSVDHASDRKNDLKEWRNLLGAILEEMLAKSGTVAAGGGWYGRLVKWTKVSIGWARKSDSELDDDPDAGDSFRVGIFILDWV